MLINGTNLNLLFVIMISRMISAYVKHGLTSNRLQIWCKLVIGKESFLVVLIYRPNDTDVVINKETNKCISFASSLIRKNKYTGPLITGDFNFPKIKWETSFGHICGKGRNSSVDFLESIDSNSLKQHVIEPTYGKNTLDLVFT